jgi:hypothetical protein
VTSRRETPSTLNLPELPFRVFNEVRAGLLSVPWSEGQRRIEPVSTLPLPLDWD